MTIDKKVIEDAMWAGDVETLRRLAPCECASAEDSLESCPARQWHGCIGQFSEDDED